MAVIAKTPVAKNLFLTPNSKSTAYGNLLGEYLLYKAAARSQSFQARDNISNFIKWCRYVVKVRECLMFETDDLILRKNEKNFILCLLEVARFGAKFGMQVPTIIRYEQEIEAEIEREKLVQIQIQTQVVVSDVIILDDANDEDEDEDDVKDYEDNIVINIISPSSKSCGVGLEAASIVTNHDEFASFEGAGVENDQDAKPNEDKVAILV